MQQNPANVQNYNDSVYNFSSMNQFFNEVENRMQDQLKNVPLDILWALGSLILALSVLTFVTFNPLISLYTIITISTAIIVTIASPVFLGWKLNVLESVAVCTAIGLTVDFSLHYVVSYRASISKGMEDKVKTALMQMGGSMLMAYLTSKVTGALMLSSFVLTYIQIGIFLLLVMTRSCIYATFFIAITISNVCVTSLRLVLSDTFVLKYYIFRKARVTTRDVSHEI